MNLFDLLDSRDKKKRMSHIKNLIAVACSDGSFDKNEMELISGIGLSAGLSREELKRIMARPESVSFTPPENYRERVEQLYDMVLVMMVDGEFHKNEVALCKFFAINLGFDHHIIDDMVHKTVEMIVDGIEADIALDRLHSMVS